jgi:hypothetical protein
VLLCESRMVGDFGGMAEMGEAERERVVRGWRKRYALGLVGVGDREVEEPGRGRWVIDEARFVISVEEA